MRRTLRHAQSQVSRRALLAGLAVAPVALIPAFGDAPDPILTLCAEWHAANDYLNECCIRKQKLETALVKRIGFPRVHFQWRGKSYSTGDPEKIDHLFGKRHIAEATRLKAELAREQEEWDRQALACGFTEADLQEEAAMHHVDDIMRRVGEMPASSFAGIVAKLSVASAIGKMECPDPDEFPWSFINSALNDLRQLTQAFNTCGI